jgi:hypothetical protein
MLETLAARESQVQGMLQRLSLTQPTAAEEPRLCFATLVQQDWEQKSCCARLFDPGELRRAWAVPLAVDFLDYACLMLCFVLTARKVFTMLAMAASASPSSSWIGAFLMSSLNCGVGLLSAWVLVDHQLGSKYSNKDIHTIPPHVLLR